MTVADRPVTRVRIPQEDDFLGADFMADSALTELYNDVLRSYARLAVIEDHGITVSVLWKRKGGKKQGAPTFAKCQKPSGLLGFYCPADFVIWLGADTIAEQEWTTAQIRKLIYHEARHIGWDDGDEDHDGKPIILGHDVELFVGEIEDTGPWEHFRRSLHSEFAQGQMFDGPSGPAPEDDDLDPLADPAVI